MAKPERDPNQSPTGVAPVIDVLWQGNSQKCSYEYKNKH